MTPASDAAGAVAFLTPVGGGRAPSPGALAWFPAVGASMGLALGGVCCVASQVWPPPVVAAVVVVADLGLTGLLHLDGLIDAADGLLPHLDRQRRLDVMADPRAGAFGVGAAAAVLLVRWSALAAVPPSPLLLAGLWCASRTAMAVIARTLPYARPTGLATAFLDPRAQSPAQGAARAQSLAQGAARARGGRPAALAVGGLIGSLAMAGAGGGLSGVAAVGALTAAAVGVMALAQRRLGGFTGDVLGAAGLVGETVGLVVAAARPRWRMT
ncbi:MAG: adenosylcobinamide-GDP ribazoletransferase [Acidimicrobiales bacterium]